MSFATCVAQQCVCCACLQRMACGQKGESCQDFVYVWALLSESTINWHWIAFQCSLFQKTCISDHTWHVPCVGMVVVSSLVDVACCTHAPCLTESNIKFEHATLFLNCFGRRLPRCVLDAHFVGFECCCFACFVLFHQGALGFVLKNVRAIYCNWCAKSDFAIRISEEGLGDNHFQICAVLFGFPTNQAFFARCGWSRNCGPRRNLRVIFPH